jgi:hypothetical protein
MLRYSLLVSQRLPIKAPHRPQFCTTQQLRHSLENIPGSQLLPDNLSVKDTGRLAHDFVCHCCLKKRYSEMAMEIVRFFLKHYPAGAAELLNIIYT